MCCPLDEGPVPHWLYEECELGLEEKPCTQSAVLDAVPALPRVAASPWVSSCLQNKSDNNLCSQIEHTEHGKACAPPGRRVIKQECRVLAALPAAAAAWCGSHSRELTLPSTRRAGRTLHSIGAGESTH